MNKKNKWVIKAGSSLVSGDHAGINSNFINDLVNQVDYLRKNGQNVVIISSGAVTKGMHEMGMKERPASLHLFKNSKYNFCEFSSSAISIEEN